MSDKPKRVIQSRDLDAYKLNKGLRTLLDRAEKYRNYMLSAGRTPPNEIRLYKHHIQDINNCVLQQSDRKLSVQDVLWRGLILVAHDETPPTFKLEAGK